jgi:hypothetical protein
MGVGVGANTPLPVSCAGLSHRDKAGFAAHSSIIPRLHHAGPVGGRAEALSKVLRVSRPRGSP